MYAFMYTRMHVNVYVCICIYKILCIYVNTYIRRPLPSLGLGGAAPGITAGVRPWQWPYLRKLCQLLRNNWLVSVSSLQLSTPYLCLLCQLLSNHWPASVSSSLQLSTAAVARCVSKLGLSWAYLRFRNPVNLSSQRSRLCQCRSKPRKPRKVGLSWAYIRFRNCYVAV